MAYLIGFILAFCLAIVFTKIVIPLTFKYGFLDNPKRKHGAILHNVPIPRAGGVPVYLSFLVASCLVFSLQFSDIFVNANLKHIAGIMLAGLFIVSMGLVDDKYDISARTRLILMFGFALIVVASGIGISYMTNPLGGIIRFDEIVIPVGFPYSSSTIVLFADIIAVIWIVSLMNMVNWSSGVDGQNAGIAVVALAVLGFSALRYNNVSEPTAMLAFIGSGAFLGFLLFSAYPQKIMPGFGGSTFSGFLIAVLAILSGAKMATVALVLAIPILDALWVGSRRIMKGGSPMKNDRSHLHHYLLDIGWSKRQVAFFYWLTSGFLGLLTLQIDSKTKLFTLLGCVLIFLVGVIWVQKRLLQSQKL